MERLLIYVFIPITTGIGFFQCAAKIGEIGSGRCSGLNHL